MCLLAPGTFRFIHIAVEIQINHKPGHCFVSVLGKIKKVTKKYFCYPLKLVSVLSCQMKRGGLLILLLYPAYIEVLCARNLKTFQFKNWAKLRMSH